MAVAVRVYPSRGRIFLKCRSSFKLCRHLTRNASGLTGNPTADKALQTVTGGRINRWLDSYENFVGLTEVREAQNKVIEAETKFLNIQEKRRKKQENLHLVQSRLKTINAELEKVHRGEDKYLMLLTQEHEVIKQDTSMTEEVIILEKGEREYFSALSAAVRESHEKERARTERTKYWSIMGSIIGAMIGILGTTLNNYLRMRELRGMIKDSTAGSGEARSLVTDLSETMQLQHANLTHFVRDLKLLLGFDNVNQNNINNSASKGVLSLKQNNVDVLEIENLHVQSKEILELIRKQDEYLVKDMADIKKIISVDKAKDSVGNVVYVGPEMEDILSKQEQNLEWKIKMNSLATVTAIYGALAITVPILYQIFKGGS